MSREKLEHYNLFRRKKTYYYILYLKDQIKILSDAYLLYVVRSRWYDKVVMDAFKEIKIELEYKKYELNTIYYYKKRGWEI